MSLYRQVVSGIKWSFSAQLLQQGMQIITTIILARLLAPQDFGLIGMAMVFIGFISLFGDLGTSAALIQREDPSDDLFSSIFWINVILGICITALLFITAPFIASIYNEPRIVPIIKLLSFSFIISSTNIVHTTILQRELNFRTISRIQISSFVISSAVAISAAFYGAGVWSLVFQSLAGTFLSSSLFWIMSPWRPKFIFNMEEAKSVMGFSSNLIGFNAINYLKRNADDFLIGKFIGAQELGYYTLAYRILLFPIQNVSAVIGKVVFPFYSRIKDDEKRFQNAYLIVAGSIALITFPIMFGLLAVVEPFVFTVFGPDWSQIIPLLVVFIPLGLTQSIGTTVGAIYQAKGRTDIMFKWGLVSSVITILAFCIGVNWGVMGVAVAYAACTILLSYPGFVIPLRLVNLKFSDLLSSVLPAFVSSFIMFGIVKLSHISLSDSIEAWVALLILVPLGALIYLLGSFLLNKRLLNEVASTLRSKS